VRPTMSTDFRRLDAIREDCSELENHHVDELLAGRLSRRQFVQKGAVIGLSTGVMGAILSACGSANKTGAAASSSTSASTSSAPAAKGGTVKFGQQAPAASINPLTIDDVGGLNVITQTAEFLTFDRVGTLEPMLATKWTPSAGGRVWTFTLRQGVKFHDGSTMNADDVVYSFKQLADPKNDSNALSTFDGVLTVAGIRKVNDRQVAFHLEAEIGNFPFLVSNDNYNAIIVPNHTDYAKWQKTFVGTGPFVLKSYTQNVGATFTTNPDYWGTKPSLDGSAFTFYQSQQPSIVGLQGGQVDGIVEFVAQGAQAILGSSKYQIINQKSSLHRELSMRNDKPPFNDARVRQAMALCLDRPAMVKALLDGYGQVGNDSPFAPVFKSTDTSVPQRVQDLAKAKQLLAAAGHPHGFSATLYTEQYEEMPALAQVIQSYAKQIGIDINLKVETQDAYYGKATYGNSNWLDGEMSLVDYGDRGVPNVFLAATLTSTGPWNAAHFRNATYDNLVKQYVATVDLATQTRIAGKIQRLLLAETPLIIPYFFDGLTATTTNVQGVVPTGLSQVYLDKASLTSA
jgi:peptide/nickel transport system substrate-binding protein